LKLARVKLGIAVVGLLTSSSCIPLGPAESFPTADVVGTIRIGDNMPLKGGWVEFTPIDGALGHLRSAPIESDGSFKIRGVAVGMNAVRLVEPKAEKMPSYVAGVQLAEFQKYTSPIRRKIALGSGQRADFDLYEEAIRFQRLQRVE
jgi:hypothetical protein